MGDGIGHVGEAVSGDAWTCSNGPDRLSYRVAVTVADARSWSAPVPLTSSFRCAYLFLGGFRIGR